MHMRLIHTTTTDPDGMILNALGWYNSTLNLFGPSSEKNILRKIVSRTLRLALSPIEQWLDCGAAYTTVHQKTD
jgi:hypothetical protein